MSNDKRRIAIWPDYTWCDMEEIEDFSWKSDDYSVVSVPWDLSDEEIEMRVLVGELK